MDEITRWLEANLGLSPQVQSRILESLVVVLVLWVMRQIVLRTVVYRMSDDRRRYQWQKTLGYVFFTLVVLLVWPIWFRGFQSLATYLGLLSAGLAIALKDPITDLIGWGFILWRRSFEVGDRIQIGEYAGDVIDQRIFQFSLMEVGNWVDAEQSTGRVLHVPNGMIFTNVLANYTKGSRYIWNEIPVLVTFESDWEKAKQILREIARHHSEQLSEGAEESFKQASKQYLINYGTLTSTIYTSVKDSGVLLTMRYLCEPRKRRDSTEQVWESILRAFAPHPDIDFAYPTRRLYNNQVEGKQAAGSQSQVKEFSDS
jgi:small-conductance mechanosensitive channel